MSEPKDYGRYYWCIGVPSAVAKRREIYAMADRIEISPHGDLSLMHDEVKRSLPNLILAAGQWEWIYAASVFDGSAVAVDHWAEQIVEEK